MAVDPTGTLLAVANYGDGTVSVHGIDESGLLTDVWTFSHGEPTHAHQTVFGPDGVMYVSDLGADEVRRYLVTDQVVPHPDGPVRLAAAMGPRHMARRGDHWYVAGELDGTVRVYDAGWREISAVEASGVEGKNQPSHLEVSGGSSTSPTGAPTRSRSSPVPAWRGSRRFPAAVTGRGTSPSRTAGCTWPTSARTESPYCS